MFETVTRYDFTERFRTLRPENFTYEGQKALFDYLEQMEEDTGEQELDVISLCVEYAEYENLAEFQSDFNDDEYETIQDIEDMTTVIHIDNEAFIIAQF